MKVFILTSLVFLISLGGCSSSEKKPNLLEERAGYKIDSIPIAGIGQSGSVQLVPTRVPEKVVVAWLHEHDMPSKAYFWGSWLSIVVEDERWEMVKVDVPSADKKTQRTPEKPKSKSRPKPKAQMGAGKSSQRETNGT